MYGCVYIYISYEKKTNRFWFEASLWDTDYVPFVDVAFGVHFIIYFSALLYFMFDLNVDTWKKYKKKAHYSKESNHQKRIPVIFSPWDL